MYWMQLQELKGGVDQHNTAYGGLAVAVLVGPCLQQIPAGIH